MQNNCDVLIVGGGPAGGLAAWLLARAGRAVTLIEAQPVLGERVCGAYLCPAGVALLDELGLCAKLTADMRPLLGMVLVSPNRKHLQTRFPANDRVPDFGISLRRPEFDNALLRVATQSGATVLMDKRPQSLQPTHTGWRVQLADGEIISTRLLIGADGRKSRVARLLNLATDPWQERVALHVDVPSLVPTEPYGEMHVFPDGTYIGLNPTGLHTWNISALCDPSELRRTMAMDFINQRTQASEHLYPRIAPLRDAATVRTTFPAAAGVRNVVATNAALIGDASGFIDPLTGEGIYQALWTARVLSREVSRAWSDDSALNAALGRYASQRRRQHRAKRWCCQAFQAIIRRPGLSNAVHDLLSLREGVGNSFIGMIGNILHPWPGLLEHDESPRLKYFMMHAYLNEIGTAVPTSECQQHFLDSLPSWIPDAAVVDKMRVIAKRSGIAARHTVLDQVVGQPGSGAFYEIGSFPGTGRRMEVYREAAPALAVKAVRALEARGVELNSITHLVITSCTGFYAPGLDVDLIRLLGLPRNVCRTVIGFMGCYAGITGLRAANDIVRAEPEARVLVVNLELCTLHLQQDAPIDQFVASLLFSDGCAASLVSARPVGFRLDSFASHLSLEDADKMQWLIGDHGFAMKLDADIPERIRDYLGRHIDGFDRALSNPKALWAIHPGGRAILDAVRSAFSLTPEQVAPARRVLACYGNMSSASIMFVFEELLRRTPQSESRPGAAIAFGPGLTLKAMEFTYVPPAGAANFRNAEFAGATLSPAI